MSNESNSTKRCSQRGKKGDVIKVSDGYGMNFLIQRGLAEPASENNVKILQNQKLEDAHLEALHIEEMQQLKIKLEGLVLNFKLSVHDGKVNGTVSMKQIEERLAKEFGIVIDKKKFISHVNLHEIGLNYLDIKLANEVIARLKVQIEAAE